jgi:filamentous hemagglutinin
VTQTGATTLAVTGTSGFTNGTGNDITLANTGNDFGGVVTITSGNNVSLKDATGLSLGGANASGNLTAVGTGLLSVAGNVSGQAVSLQGAGVTNTASITGATNVTVDAGSGLLDNSGGTVTNSGPGTAPLVLKGDSMSLIGGAIAGQAAPVTLTSGTAGRVISLIAGGGLQFSQAELNLPTTTGGLVVGDALHTADITSRRHRGDTSRKQRRFHHQRRLRRCGRR